MPRSGCSSLHGVNSNKKKKKMLCNTLIQSHYDFAFCSWYLNLSMSQKTKLQATQNSCIRYCLGLKYTSHIWKNQSEKNKLANSFSGIHQCLAKTAYNFKTMLFLQNIWVISTPWISPVIRTCQSTDSFVLLFL